MLGFGGKKASDNGPNSKGAHVVVIGNEKAVVENLPRLCT